MQREEREALITNHLIQLKLVVTAILVSVALLAGVSFVIAESGKAPPPKADTETLLVVLAPLAVALLGIAPAVKRAIFKRAEAAGFGGDAALWLGAHRTSVIVASALREGAAILGFALGLLSAQPLWSYGFSGLALVTLVLDWPRASELEE